MSAKFASAKKRGEFHFLFELKISLLKKKEVMPRLLHHINIVDRQLAHNLNFKRVLLQLIRYIIQHLNHYGDLQILNNLLIEAKKVYKIIIVSQRYVLEYGL